MNNSTPKISIILPTYNRAHIIGESINAVLNQTYPHFELIIIDDCSTDNTEDFIKNHTDERIKYIKLKENKGASGARNEGIKVAKYDYIAFCDSDDCFDERKLELQINAFLESNDNKLGFVYHKFKYVTGRLSGVVFPNNEWPIEDMSGNLYERLFLGNLIGCPTIMATRECIEASGFFDETYPALEDYDYALKMAKNFHGKFVNEILLYCSDERDGVSSNYQNNLVASCLLINRYKNDLIATNTLNYRMEKVLNDAKEVGLLNEIAPLLERCVSLAPM